MNILYLSERDPRDNNFGGAQRTNFIWKALQKLGNVYCVYYTFYEEDTEIAPNIWRLKKNIDLDNKQYFWYRVWRKLLKNLNVLPLWPTAPRSKKSPEELFGVKFDIVVARYCFDLSEMHLWNYPKVYVDFDDHPMEMFNTIKKNEVNYLLRSLSRFIIKQQLNFLERKITFGWISNPEQVKMFSNKNIILPLKNIALEPSNQYNPRSIRTPKLITVGVMSYFPNYSGVEKFLNEIWPTFHNTHPDIEYHIIGKDVPKQYKSKWEKLEGVILRGFVENLEKEYEDSLCSIVPVDSGGGTCIKTLESLSFSRICLATPFGARGLEQTISKQDIGIYIYNDYNKFMNLFHDKVLDVEKRYVHECNGKDFIVRNHSQDAFISTVINTINS